MTSDRATRILAAAVAVALNLVIVSVLWRLPSVAGVQVADEAIQIHWIQRTSDNTRASLLTGVPAPAVFPKTVAAPSKPLKVAVAPASRAILVVEDDSWDAPASDQPERFTPVVSSTLLPREKISFLERQTAMIFAMQDSSAMAKLDRLGVASVCNRLRMLALGSDLQLQEHRTSREVILRTMQNEKCRL